MATSNGLNRYDPLIDGFERFYSDSLSSNSLSSEDIYHLIEDTHGNLWIGHDKGINRLNPSTKEFKRFPNIFEI